MTLRWEAQIVRLLTAAGHWPACLLTPLAASEGPKSGPHFLHSSLPADFLEGAILAKSLFLHLPLQAVYTGHFYLNALRKHVETSPAGQLPSPQWLETPRATCSSWDEWTVLLCAGTQRGIIYSRAKQ